MVNFESFSICFRIFLSFFRLAIISAAFAGVSAYILNLTIPPLEVHQREVI
jgi:hypothetical protein